MTVEDFLMGYRNAMDRVAELDEDIQETEYQLQPGNSYNKMRVRSSGGRREAEAKLGDMVLRRSQLLQEAEMERERILTFIDQIGGSDVRSDRHRRLLRLYYADGFSWNQIRRIIQPLRIRKDGQAVTRRGVTGISKATMYRIRLDALSEAEVAWRRRK